MMDSHSADARSTRRSFLRGTAATATALAAASVVSTSGCADSMIRSSRRRGAALHMRLACIHASGSARLPPKSPRSAPREASGRGASATPRHHGPSLNDESS